MPSAGDSPPQRRTREQVEDELLARLDAKRVRYEKLKHSAMQSATPLYEIAADALGNSDGTLALRKIHAQARQSNRALVEYREALKEFTDFVVDGKIPKRPPRSSTVS